MTRMQLKLTEPTCPRLADLKDQAKQRTHDERPAYPGGKFNKDGLCTRHATIRLCRVTNAGTYKKYQILHKVCSKCDTTTAQQQHSSLAARARDHPSRHSESNLLRYEERAQGGIVSRTTPSGESTDSKDESGVALDPPSHHHRKWERRSRLKGRNNGEVKRSRQKRSHSRPRKVVVRKQSSMTKEGDDDTSPNMSSPPLPSVEDMIKDITITAPLKDLPSVNIEKNDVLPADDDDATLPTLPLSQCSELSSQSSQLPSANLKQQIRDLSGLLLKVQMKDSADKLSAIIQDDHSSSTGVQSQSEENSWNTIRDDASASYLHRKSKRDQSSTRRVAFREYLETREYLESSPVQEWR
ncbi:hypothetical protein ACHAWC_008750 [Mediolabrus comicus]